MLQLLAQGGLDEPVTEEAVAWALAHVLADEDDESLRVIAGMTDATPRDELRSWLRRAAMARGVRVPTREESRRLVFLNDIRQCADLAREIAGHRGSLVHAFQHLYYVYRKMHFGADVVHDLAQTFRPVIGIASRLDRFPSREDRVQWSAEALDRLDEEARAFDVEMRGRAAEICAQLADALDGEVARISEAFFTTR